MKRHRKDLEVNSEINITNLLDTSFILLIAFMIVAPTLKSGIPVNLPKIDNPESIEDERDNYLITVVPRDQESVSDQVYLNKEPIPIDELSLRMLRAFEANPEVTVTIESDSKATWGTVLRIISICHDVGIEYYDFLGQADANRSP